MHSTLGQLRFNHTNTNNVVHRLSWAYINVFLWWGLERLIKTISENVFLMVPVKPKQKQTFKTTGLNFSYANKPEESFQWLFSWSWFCFFTLTGMSGDKDFLLWLMFSYNTQETNGFSSFSGEIDWFALGKSRNYAMSVFTNQ